LVLRFESSDLRNRPEDVRSAIRVVLQAQKLRR
jgi:hypothetical protein